MTPAELEKVVSYQLDVAAIRQFGDRSVVSDSVERAARHTFYLRPRAKASRASPRAIMRPTPGEGSSL
jgi:hypothetical protein